MKAISHFLRITVLGGILFLTPIVVLVFILSKAFDFSRRALKPATAIIPDRFVSGVTMEAVLASTEDSNSAMIRCAGLVVEGSCL
jgi:hypothetical protein